MGKLAIESVTPTAQLQAYPPFLNYAGQRSCVLHSDPASVNPIDEESHNPSEAHTLGADLINQIKETHRQRQDLHRAEKSLTLQIKAVGRRLNGGQTCVEPQNETAANPLEEVDQQNTEPQNRDVAFLSTLPLQEAKALIHKARLKPERQLKKLAMQLPVWDWVEAINGFGAMGLGQIIAETGDLSNYANPAKLWKRMGLAVINGESQRKKCGAAALEHGYSPVRRSIMYCIGDSMIKKQNPYRELYLKRKEYEEQKKPDGSKMLWHRRAQRYMEKRLLKDLWIVWRQVQL